MQGAVDMGETMVKRDDSLAWDNTALVSPHDDKTKAARVNAMFTAIAPSYDLNNRLHSLWRDQAWRRKAVRLAGVRREEDVVIDVACGTGDLTFAFAQAWPKRIIGIDFVPKMLEIARAKLESRFEHAGWRERVEFRPGDAMNLELNDASADVVSIAFGIRNVADPAKALAEFRRILRPGGRLVILEFDLPSSPILRRLYQWYFNHVLPRTATWISGDRSGAYKYLPRSVTTFLDRNAMRKLLIEQVGFDSVEVHPMTFGICVAYVARVPGDASSAR
jgi:demethylmenaquinone methyltransferase/2-methoxy-6-polyprenyl-1,4-benzoquinol methylase